jgi:cell wall-associated NlpC family hydrolase
MTPAQLLARARSASGKGVVYKLGAGGMKPGNLMPSDAQNRCDCSGFVCWALQVSRETDHPLFVNFNGGWINTNAIVHDASQSTGLFRPAPLIIPGVILVYPGGGTRKVGHCGIVTKLHSNGALALVIHCSSGNSNRGDAIQETPPDVFQIPETIAVWFEGMSQKAATASRQPRFG